MNTQTERWDFSSFLPVRSWVEVLPVPKSIKWDGICTEMVGFGGEGQERRGSSPEMGDEEKESSLVVHANYSLSTRSILWWLFVQEKLTKAGKEIEIVIIF